MAPLNRDSGTKRRHRTTSDGRAPVLTAHALAGCPDYGCGTGLMQSHMVGGGGANVTANRLTFGTD